MVSAKSRYIFLIFTLVSVILRFYSFFPGVIDHDESTYLIIGRDLAQGRQLYTDVTDTKPVGIFLIYALFHELFGYSIFLTRLVVALLIALTAFLINQAALKLQENRMVAFAAGFIYIFYTSVWSQFGLSPNTEQFFNLTTVAGFLFLLKGGNRYFFLSGLLFGTGFIIKYLVLFDFVFLFAFFLVRDLIQNNWNLRKAGILKYILGGIGFLLPFILSNLYFWFSGHWEAFRYITYELPGKYGQNPEILKYLVLLLDYLARFLPVSFLFFYVLFSKKKVLPEWQVFMFLFWIAGILIAMYLPGKSFDHYTIQLMVPFSFVAAMFFHPSLTKDKFAKFIFGKKNGFIFLVVLVLVVQVSGITGIVSENDRPRRVAQYLKQNMKEDETIYLSNYKHIVYYLLKKECPTKYVHPTLLTNPDHARAFAIDGHAEIKNIVAQKPHWVVMYDNNLFVKELIKSNYSLDTSFFNKRVELYKLTENF